MGLVSNWTPIWHGKGVMLKSLSTTRNASLWPSLSLRQAAPHVNVRFMACESERWILFYPQTPPKTCGNNSRLVDGHSGSIVVHLLLAEKIAEHGRLEVARFSVKGFRWSGSLTELLGGLPWS